MAVEEQNIELVKKLIEGINGRNAGIYEELYTDDYVWYFPSIKPKPYSRVEEMEFVKLIWEGFPDISWTVADIFAADDRVLAKFVARGTHDGEYQGMAPTGKKIEASGFVVYRVDSGKFAEAWEEADLLGMMQQLGMELRQTVAED